MKQPNITQQTADMIFEALDQLKEVLLDAGITELRISKKQLEIFWDSDGEGFDVPTINKFATSMDDLFIEVLQSKQ